jgi:glycerol-3-phosphate dehydrogenase
MEGRLVLRAGLRLYDLVALDRNWSIRDRARRIAPGYLLSRGQVLDLYPALPSKGLTGAGLFYDGQFYNPPRLSLAFLRAAVDAGAAAANYIEVIGFLGDRGRVRGVIARDRLTGNRLEIRAEMVLNTAGPWAAKLLRETLGMSLPTIFSRDTGFVVRGRRTGDHALACRIGLKDPDALLSRHGRHVFLVPWRDYTLVGVWHRVHTGRPDELEVREEEIRTWLDDVNGAYPALDLRLGDVSMIHAGLTLFEENSPDAKDLRFGKRSLLIDHRQQHGIAGLMTLVGVRATTARGMAERAVDRLLRMLGRSGPSSRTAVTALPGGRIESFDDFLQAALREHAPRYGAKVIRSLVHKYGS